MLCDCTELETTSYDVTVYTGDVFGAGTNANVSLTMFGENGESGKLALKQSGRDLFERKQIDKFTLECLDLGESAVSASITRSPRKRKILLVLRDEVNFLNNQSELF